LSYSLPHTSQTATAHLVKSQCASLIAVSKCRQHERR
jgi:hypothetical protein